MRYRQQFNSAAVRAAVVALVLLLMPGFAWIEKFFAPDIEAWPRWERHDDSNDSEILHDQWSVFLERYVRTDADGVNRVAYGRVSASDRRHLDSYVAALTALPISTYRRSVQLAYWINLYNAHTVQLVLAHYPVKSITEIDASPGIFSSGPWDGKSLTVEAQALSLNDIEHRILRPGWRDSRLHYVLNCASLGCPNLPRTAITPENTERFLEYGAKTYINHPRGVYVTKEGIRASKIYAWFAEDFGRSEELVIDHFRKYAAPELREDLAGKRSISGFVYDWSLNDDIAGN